ncbi:MAG: YndJ family transporter [Bacteroidota bacterium]
MSKSTYPYFGLVTWLLLCVWQWPPSPLHLDYVRLILSAAPLVIVPLCHAMDGRSFWLTFALGAAFSLGMLLPVGGVGFGLVLPWWMFSAYLTVHYGARWVSGQLAKRSEGKESKLRLQSSHGTQRSSHLFFSSACSVSLLVAASWAIADRLELSPMGFDTTIVLLTAVHFHYAGFTLIWLLGRLRGPAWMEWAIVLGVALVAVGITTSQYGLPAWIEVVSVTILATAALRFARLLWQQKQLLFRLGSLALAGGMVLALAYGWRYYFPVRGLEIPVMYALHGSLNSLGFALPVVWAFHWRHRYE